MDITDQRTDTTGSTLFGLVEEGGRSYKASTSQLGEGSPLDWQPMADVVVAEGEHPAPPPVEN